MKCCVHAATILTSLRGLQFSTRDAVATLCEPYPVILSHHFGPILITLTLWLVLPQVARRLALVGCAIEAYYDKVSQDIEGGLVATDSSGSDVEIFIFQTRPQH